jgi:acetyl esterase/lipase
MISMHFTRVFALSFGIGFGLNAGAHSETKVAKPAEKKAKPAKVAKSSAVKEITADSVEVYKTIDDVKLNAYLFLPEGHQPTDRRAAMVFFFGGGWTGGSPAQFVEHCKHLASKGMVAITVDYRVASRHGVKAISCVRDAKSAIRWTRQNATRLGIDPDRIAAGGGSAGGHLAACTGVIDGLDETSEDMSISSKPNAMALFNPAVMLADIKGSTAQEQERIDGLAERAGVDSVVISPFHHVSKDAPPTIIFHGKADTTVPYFTVEKFTDAMKSAGADCELVGFEGAAHGFFNYGRGDGTAFNETLIKLDEFLQRLRYID